jgi:hypothetical protein
MKVRKSLFAVLAVGLLVGGSSIVERASQKAVARPKLVADGTDPMPLPKPRGGSVIVDEAVLGVLVADGTDPMPLPKPTRGTSIVTDEAVSSVLVADGTDPMPRPPRKLA